MVHEAVVEVLTTQVGVTGSGLDLEDTLLDGKKRHIESSSSEIEDEDVALADHLLVETIRNSGGGGLVDNTKDVHSGDGSGVLGSLTLRVVEVRRDRHDGVRDGRAEVRLSGLLHLQENHRGDLFRGLNHRVSAFNKSLQIAEMPLTNSLLSPRY